MELELLQTPIPRELSSSDLSMVLKDPTPKAVFTSIRPDAELSYFEQPFSWGHLLKTEETVACIGCLRQWIPVSISRLIKKLYRERWGSDVHRGLEKL